jgi:hypothetical protein
VGVRLVISVLRLVVATEKERSMVRVLASWLEGGGLVRVDGGVFAVGGRIVNCPPHAASKNGHLGHRIARWHFHSRVLHLMVRSLYFSFLNSLGWG